MANKMNWDIHQENITILGMQGSGKTTLARQFLDSIPNVPRLIISPQRPMELYGAYGNPISTLEEIQPNGAFVWIGNKPDEDTLNKICKKIMTFSNFLMLVDDSHEFCKKQKMPKEWSTLINSGRNRGITSIFLSPSPNLLNNVILQSSQHLISFKFALESQIEYSKKNFFGDIAYLLLFQPARPAKFQKCKELEKHDYLHRSVNDDFVTLTFGTGETIQLNSIHDINENRTEEPDKELESIENDEKKDQEKPNNEHEEIQEEPEIIPDDK